MLLDTECKGSINRSQDPLCLESDIWSFLNKTILDQALPSNFLGTPYSYNVFYHLVKGGKGRQLVYRHQDFRLVSLCLGGKCLHGFLLF